jgi:hypothetical protein
MASFRFNNSDFGCSSIELHHFRSVSMNNQFKIQSLSLSLMCVILTICRKQALQAKLEAEKEGIVVPLTLEEYCLKPKPNPNNQEPQVRVAFYHFQIHFSND